MIPRADRRHMDETIRAAVHGAFAELMAPLLAQADFQKRLAMAIAARLPATAAPVDSAAPSAAAQAEGPKAKPWTVHKAEVKAEALPLYAEGDGLMKVGKRLGIPPATLARWVNEAGIMRSSAWSGPGRKKEAAPPAEPEALAQPVAEVPPPPAAVAPEPAPVAAPEPARTVVMVPVLAPMKPLPPVPGIPAIAPLPPRTREAEAATPKAVRQWLEATLRNGGLGKLAAEDKVAAMTHDQALQQANIRRAAMKQPLFVFHGAKA